MTKIVLLSMLIAARFQTEHSLSPVGNWKFAPEFEALHPIKGEKRGQHRFPVFIFKSDHTFSHMSEFFEGKWAMEGSVVILTFEKHAKLLTLWKVNRPGTTNQTELILSRDQRRLDWNMQNTKTRHRQPIWFVKM